MDSKGKEYRLPREEEFEAAEVSKQEELEAFYVEHSIRTSGTKSISPERAVTKLTRDVRHTTLRPQHLGPSCSAAGNSWRWAFDCSGTFASVQRGDGKSQRLPGRVAAKRLSLAWRRRSAGSPIVAALLLTWTNDRDQLRNTFARFALAYGLGFRGILSV